MAEMIEAIYREFLREIRGFEIPLSLRMPSGQLVDKKMATNDISLAFSKLNRILASLGMKPFDFSLYIIKIRESETTKEDLVDILVKLNDILERKKGDAIKNIAIRMEEFKV